MNIPELLEAKGIDYVSKVGAEIAIICPNQAAHSDCVDSNASFNINTEKQVGHCLACGFKLSVTGMQRWLLGGELDEDQLKTMALRNKLKKLQVDNSEGLFLAEAEEFTMMPPGKPFDYEFRGVSVETYKKLGAIECQRGRYENRICFPIRQHGRLLGVDARALGDAKPKYLRPKGCQATTWLYPFDDAKRQKVRQVVLCEGIYHAINFYDKTGTPEALCFFGANNWSEHKNLLLLELSPERVVFWPDNDKAGIDAMLKIVPQVLQWFDTYIIPPEKLPTDRDLGDFSKEEIEEFMTYKVRCK